MRLKLFEEYSESYYQTIDRELYTDKPSDFIKAEFDRIKMSEKTINKIKSLFNGWDIEVGEYLEFIYLWDYEPTGNYEIKIFEVEDEYFYCYINNYNKNITDYYKCDQIEGLIQLFKDKGII